MKKLLEIHLQVAKSKQGAYQQKEPGTTPFTAAQNTLAPAEGLCLWSEAISAPDSTTTTKTCLKHAAVSTVLHTIGNVLP